MFKKILIANRGEIALRIMATCREMGIDTVAVYSEADSTAAHVLYADEAVCIGKPEPGDSYLNMDAIIDAAKGANAEAVHPGYGFLAENGEFADRCQEADLVFIGPPGTVIRNLGDKITARRIMERAGVPVMPGTTWTVRTGDNMDEVAAAADAIGYPVLVKASAGGGGKGIRIVHEPAALVDACMAASREAQTAFGDGAVYLEKFFETARHVEVQVLADTHGNVVHVLERECSIQRRHQKIIEESPSPAVTSELRDRMGEAAVAAARASGYVNAGTVEFLLAPDQSFYFLEVNTRLQVEHPVTEMITGLDLVRCQLDIAAGAQLPLTQKDIAGRGHAIECRIYAEDPENGFFPSPGRIEVLHEPSGPGIRNDCGVYAGAMVPVDYDPIISKLVVHAETRELAIRRMAKALREYVILGVKTPIPFLVDVMESPAFGAGDLSTGFIDTHFQDWRPSTGHRDIALIAWVMDAMLQKPAGRQAETESRMPTPWETLGRWQL
ncbi:MAG: acetyl-CoA carboxylase biotin carboxylase subunit [Thermodesulfobacteriota bacterium]|nr:acetyl-CoA carboxylase biotin carboxylase subunit [Thermodesulfobacteriota bacterium]